jgi:hypothetical protein
MKASEIIKSEGLVLLRERNKVSPDKGQPWEYDVKEAFTGKKTGWIYLDAFTKSAMLTVYNALPPDRQKIYDTIPFMRLVDFTWKVVKASK